jgi:hypothetical protein
MADNLDTLHLHLTHEELKDLLRRRFTRAGLDPQLLQNAIAEIALLIRALGFTTTLERLERAVQELRPPVAPVDLAEYFRRTEEAIVAYQDRMRKITPAYQPGDRIRFCGEIYEFFGYQREEGEPGYWLRAKKDEIFIPIGQEGLLEPVLH